MIKELSDIQVLTAGLLKAGAAEPWQNDGAVDERAMTWIWNQLMGETAKGDTLEFVVIVKTSQMNGGGRDDDRLDDYEKLYAGILKDWDGLLKAIIPAVYEKYYSGILDIIEFDGRTRHDDMDSLEPNLKIGQIAVDMDEIGRGFIQTLCQPLA